MPYDMYGNEVDQFGLPVWSMGYEDRAASLRGDMTPDPRRRWWPTVGGVPPLYNYVAPPGQGPLMPPQQGQQMQFQPAPPGQGPSLYGSPGMGAAVGQDMARQGQAPAPFSGQAALGSGPVAGGYGGGMESAVRSDLARQGAAPAPQGGQAALGGGSVGRGAAAGGGGPTSPAGPGETTLGGSMVGIGQTIADVAGAATPPGEGGAGGPAGDPNMPPGVDAEWWEAFKAEHGGENPLQFYERTGHGIDEALADRGWGDQFFRETGRKPNALEWKDHFYQTGGYRRAAQGGRFMQPGQAPPAPYQGGGGGREPGPAAAAQPPAVAPPGTQPPAPGPQVPGPGGLPGPVFQPEPAPILTPPGSQLPPPGVVQPGIQPGIQPEVVAPGGRLPRPEDYWTNPGGRPSVPPLP